MKHVLYGESYFKHEGILKRERSYRSYVNHNNVEFLLLIIESRRAQMNIKECCKNIMQLIAVTWEWGAKNIKEEEIKERLNLVHSFSEDRCCTVLRLFNHERRRRMSPEPKNMQKIKLSWFSEPCLLAHSILPSTFCDTALLDVSAVLTLLAV